jgi:hypothetical protein
MEAQPARNRNKAELRCRQCRRLFIPRRPDRPQVFCRRACAYASYRDPFTPKSPLSKFLVGQWLESGETFTTYARALGLVPATLRNLVRGKLPRERTLAHLQATFGDALPATPNYSDRLRERLEANREQSLQVLRSPATVEKSAAARRGKHMSPEAVAKSMESRRATGGLARSVAGLTAHQQSPRGRSVAALTMRLHFTPKPEQEQLRTWAELTAQKVGLRAKQVFATWRPYLQKRGLAPRAPGRPLNETRHQLLAALMREAPRTASGRLPAGFWAAAQRRIVGEEGDDAPLDYAALQNWYTKHRLACPDRYPGEYDRTAHGRG